MTISHRFARLSAALVAGAAATILVSGVALAALPDTALEMPSGDTVLIGVVVLLGAITVTADRFSTVRR